MELRNKEITQIEQINEEAGADLTSAPVGSEEKKPNFINRFLKSGFFNKPIIVLFVIFAISLAIYLVSRFIPALAEFWTRYPAQAFRFILAKLTGWFPFSLAECLIVSLPLLAIAYIIASSVSTKRDESMENFYKWIRPLVSLILVLGILFFSAFGPAYGRYKLTENLDIEQKKVSAEQLQDTAKIVSDELSVMLDKVNFDYEGASIMPYDYKTLVKKMNQAFDKYAESVDYISHFNSNPKAISLSSVMTYTHISGVYTFMTGESNINTNYPDFLVPYTMAHEMAHQRGIAREDEANFVAFLVCIGSDDDYIRYCGYTNMLNYLNSALSKADAELYKSFVYGYMPKPLLYEFVAYSQFFDKYRDSVASEVTGTVNDVFLQSQGQKAGTQSYGLVVDLAVAYYESLN